MGTNSRDETCRAICECTLDSQCFVLLTVINSSKAHQEAGIQNRLAEKNV